MRSAVTALLEQNKANRKRAGSGPIKPDAGAAHSDDDSKSPSRKSKKNVGTTVLPSKSGDASADVQIPRRS